MAYGTPRLLEGSDTHGVRYATMLKGSGTHGVQYATMLKGSGAYCVRDDAGSNDAYCVGDGSSGATASFRHESGR